jgi:hypothetical protein
MRGGQGNDRGERFALIPLEEVLIVRIMAYRIVAIRGLNRNHNHDLKNIFKGAAIRAAAVTGPFREFYAALVARGMKPPMAA